MREHHFTFDSVIAFLHSAPMTMARTMMHDDDDNDDNDDEEPRETTTRTTTPADNSGELFAPQLLLRND